MMANPDPLARMFVASPDPTPSPAAGGHHGAGRPVAARIRFAGCFTAVTTPFRAADGAVDLDRFREQLAHQAAGAVTGVVVLGTTGESPTVSAEERRRLLETAIAFGATNDLMIIAGTGTNSTAEAVALQKEAAELGATAGLSVNPYYNKPSQEGLYRHFMAVADATDLPVVLYNIPGRTGVALHPDTVARLAGHPNIVAVKDATGSAISVSEVASRSDLAILSGDDALTLPFMALGARGVVSVVSNILPGEVREMVDHALAGNFTAARRDHFKMLPLFQGLLSLDTNPIPVKTAMMLLGRDSGAMRLPMCPPTPAVVDSIRRLLAEVGLTPR